MDILSVFGIILGLSSVVFGNMLEGGHLSSLVNIPALMIVFGGTLGAMLLQTPLAIFVHACKRSVWVLIPPSIDRYELISKVVGWSVIARREGYLGLERILEDEPDPFARKGLQLLADASQTALLKETLELDMMVRDDLDAQAAMTFDAMGGYAPTIGIMGAVMGLIQVMENLSDPSRLGSGVAVAFVATIYGVGFANLFFIPVANKIRAQARQVQQMRELLLEGFIDISEGQSPRNIEFKLNGFLDQ